MKASFNSLRIVIVALFSLFVGGLRDQFATANAETSAGTHKVLTRRADAAHTYTHLLVKTGSDNAHAAVCGAANYPTGTTTDAPEAAEDIFNVHPLGIGESTRKVRVATALAADIDLYTAANGFAQAEPGVAGTYYHVGRSVGAAVLESAGNYIQEFKPCHPVKLTVAATPATVGAIAAAFATPGLVKFL